MKYLLLLAALLAGSSGILSGQSLEAIAREREARLEETLQRLHAQREQIQAERLPLVRELNAADARVAELDAELERARRSSDNREVQLGSVRERVEARQQELDFVRRTLLPSYFADYQAALSPGERQQEGEAIRDYNLFLEKADVGEAERLDRGLELMRSSLAQVEDSLGGRRYAGKALTPEGMMQDGRFIQVGPLLYFAAADGSLAGAVDLTGGVHAQMHPLGKPATQAIAQVAAEGQGELPVDLSLGDALALESTRDTIGEHLAKGGVWVYPILLFAFASALVAVFKAAQVFSIRHPAPQVIHDLVKAMRAGDKAQARVLAEAQPQPARDMLVAAAEHADESTEMVEEVMYESMLSTQPRLERFLNVIAVTAAAAPLLGLLGTVTGIIKTFQLMTIFGAGDPRPLISGISEALITTELGLILAIPALVLHAMLSRKVAGTMARLEKTAITLANGLARRQVDLRAS